MSYFSDAERGFSPCCSFLYRTPSDASNPKETGYLKGITMGQRLKFNVLSMCLGIALINGCGAEKAAEETSLPSEQALTQRALEIHDRVLTVDTHADTPLRMIEPGFDMAKRHDPRDTGSKVDYPRMKDGGLDAIFFCRVRCPGYSKR
jgi:hypothetical protein